MAARLYSEVLASRSSGQRYKERLDSLPCLLLHSLTPIAKDKRQPYHMKAQASYILFTAALLGFAKAGWETPTRTLNYNAFCGRRPHLPAGVGYVCLQAKYNAEGFTRESDFRGFLQPGKQNFVLYDGNPTTKTAVWENNNVQQSHHPRSPYSHHRYHTHTRVSNWDCHWLASCIASRSTSLT
ncbi:uncharacterized protein UHOD_01952 [Ustilago sp. UG-2017b]|nr:uncharacterized protein UHOD_01952 [Ustilago sp. UG-2017b]